MKHDFTRSVCACQGCIACCKRQPGPLIQGDFERIAEFLGENHETAKKHFWASPGAVVLNTLTGVLTRVGTITPQKRKGKCVFLDDNDRCKIHPVAPFGCSHFDTHMSPARAHPRSIYAVEQQQTEEYKALRDTLPPASSYKPRYG